MEIDFTFGHDFCVKESENLDAALGLLNS